MSISNVNGVLTAYQYAGKAQKMSAKETTFAEKAAATGEAGSTKEISEAEKLEAFKKEIWNEINAIPRSSSISWSINITDSAFERMMNEPEFKEKMMSIIREDAAAGRPPIVCSITTIDENGYKGYSYNDMNVGTTAYSTHSKDKNNFYRKKAEKQDYKELWEEKLREQKLQKELRDKEYFQHKRLTEYWNKRQRAATSYEANVLAEPIEGSSFDSATAETVF